MDGYLLAAVKDFHHPLRDADLHFLAHKGMRDDVIVSFKRDMVIDAHSDILPTGKFVGAFGQWQQRRLVQFFKQLFARLSQKLHFSMLQGIQQRGNCAVSRPNTQKGLFPQRGQHPTFHVLDSILYTGFVFWFSLTRAGSTATW